MEIDADFLHWALAEKDLYSCIREKKQDWELLWSKECNDIFTEDTYPNFFPPTCCARQREQDKREPVLSKKEFGPTEKLFFCSETYCFYNSCSNMYKFSSEGLNKQTLADSGAGPMATFWKVLKETDN